MRKIAVVMIFVFMGQIMLPSAAFAGALEIAYGDSSSSYALSGDYTIDGNVPSFGTGKTNDTFTISADTLTNINGGSYTGFVVQSGQTLNLNNIQTHGFDTETGAVANHYGTVNWTGASDTNIVNHSTLNLGNGGAGNFSLNAGGSITGSGQTNITGTVVNNGSISQQRINIAEGGSLRSNPELLSTASIQGYFNNDGTLIFTGGENNHYISGDGIVEFDGVITNSAYIMQDALVSSGELTTQINGIGSGIQGNVENNATIISSRVVLSDARTISGSGTLRIAGNSSQLDMRDGSVEQNSVEIGSNATLYINNSTLYTGYFRASLINEGEVINGSSDDSFTLLGGSNSGSIQRAFMPGGLKGNTFIAGDFENNGSFSQAGLTINEGGNFHTDLGNLDVDTLTNNGTLTLTGGNLNWLNLTGNGNIVIDGTVINGMTLTQDITINADKSLISLGSLQGAITNNGNLSVEGGEFNTTLSGSGVTEFEDVSLGPLATTLGNFRVVEGVSLDMNEVQSTAGTAEINGTLGMTVSDLTKDSADYTGAKLTATSVTLGDAAKLQVTFINDADTKLAKGESTGWMELIGGTIEGSWADVLSNNRYKVEAKEGSQGLIKATYVKSGEETAREAGANENEQAAARAWDNEDISDSNSTAYKLDQLSQTDAAGYVKALEDLTPVQVPMVKTNVTNINQSIYTAAASHMQYGDFAGLSAGDQYAYKSFWAQALFNNTKHDVHGGFDGNTYGGALGLDFGDLIDKTFGVGYAYANSSLNADAKTVKANTHNIFLYGNYTGVENWYFDGTLGYNFGAYKETKTVMGVTQSPKYNVNSIAVQATAQYHWTDYLTPLGSLRYIFANQAAYDDGFGQHVGASNDHTLTAMLGAKAGSEIQTANFLLKPEVTLGATFDIIQSGNDVTVSTGISSYQVKTEQLNRFGVTAGVGIAAEITEQVELALNYNGQFRSNYYNHTGALKFKYNF